MDIKVLVVTHKNYRMPSDPMYLPIAVGPNKKSVTSAKTRDDQGENIADKNNQYSELTALYWAWKNLQCEFCGIVHYRRYMSVGHCKSLEKILSKDDAETLLEKYDILVVKPRHYIETVGNHYINCHKYQHENSARQLQIIKEVLYDLTPDYVDAYNRVINGHSAHMFNMFIMNKRDIDRYCEWLFLILFEAEKRIIKENVQYERLMGSLSEFLLDTWISNNNKKIRELNLYQTELDFFKRVKRFIYRRFLEE